MAQRNPAAGHNSQVVLSEDDIEALTQYYAQDVLKKMAVADVAKAAYDETLKDVGGVFSMIKKDLRITRKDFTADLELLKLDDAEFKAHEATRNLRLKRLGAKPGEQLEMFGDTVDDQVAAEDAGYRHAARGGFGTPPDTVSPIFIPDWMRGWTRFQEEYAPKKLRAEEIINSRKVALNGDLDDDGDEEGGEDDAEIDVGARADELKASGFMDTGSEPKAPESLDPLVVDGVRYATKKLANAARASAELAAADARELQAAE